MKLIAGSLNGEHLDELLENSIGNTECVYTAVAYATSNPKLFQKCFENKIRLTFWGRYDRSVPIATPILKKFIERRSPNYVCKLVPDIFHAKVIWWKGYGVYIGSANLTSSAWGGNIEAGIFFNADEIADNDLEEQLNSFFDGIDERSTPLTEEIYKELSRFEQLNSDRVEIITRDLDNIFDRDRLLPKLKPLTLVTKITSHEKSKQKFLSEWYETLQILRDIASTVSEDRYRPAWVKPDVPIGVQADQFLHAYYYEHVFDGTKALYRQFYDENKSNPQESLLKALDWWKSLKHAPHGEDITIYEYSEYLRSKLAEDVLPQLSVKEFIEVCRRVHALRDHSLRVKHTFFGSDSPLSRMNRDERIELLSNWIWNHGSRAGKTVLETLQYLLYAGPSDKTPERLWDCANSEKWKIPQIGISSLGEIVGWARPKLYPPRNGRTSKALTALGYKVKIHVE